MKQNLMIISLLSIIACVLIWQLGSHTESDLGYQIPEGQLVFKMAEHRSEAHPTNEGVRLFAELVEERTEGAIKILIYDGYALGDEAGIIEQIGYGGIDFARISGVYLDEYIEELHTLCLPGLYESDEEMMQIFNDETIGSRISEALKNEKINVLTWYPGSTRGIFHNQSTLTLLMNEKIATPKSQMKIFEIEAMGFQPILTLQDNVNSYIDGGYVEGAEGELLDFYYNKSYYKAKHFTVTESKMPEVIVASNSALKQLTVEQQQTVAQAAKEAGLLTYQRIVEEEIHIQNILELEGVLFDDVHQIITYDASLDKLMMGIGDETLLKQIEAILTQ